MPKDPSDQTECPDYVLTRCIWQGPVAYNLKPWALVGFFCNFLLLFNYSYLHFPSLLSPVLPTSPHSILQNIQKLDRWKKKENR